MLDYADNPDKTTPKEYLDDGLYAALRYAANDSKTDKKMYVGGINCSKQNAYAEMSAVQKHFGNRGTVVAYHGVQSFVSGEVTPEEAFAIGKETARRMWGDRYQVLVTVHLNTDNIHCHFVVNPVSFTDGAKFQNKIGDHMELRRISDAVCRKYGKSVLQNSDFYKNGKSEYWMKQQGKKSHRDMLREDIERCLEHATSRWEFEAELYALGYTLDPVRMSVKAKGWERAVRLDRLGYTKESIMERLDENYFSPEYRSYRGYKPKRYALEEEMRRLEFIIDHSKNAELVFVDSMLLLLIAVLRLAVELREAVILSAELRHEARNLEQYVKDYSFLQKHSVHTMTELRQFISDTKQQIAELERERSKRDNRRRRAKTPAEKQSAEDDRKEITKQITPLRNRLRQAENILDKSPRLYELLRTEQSFERHEKSKNYER